MQITNLSVSTQMEEVKRSLCALVKFAGLDEEAALSCPAAGFVLAFRRGDFLHIKQVRHFLASVLWVLLLWKPRTLLGVQQRLADRSRGGPRHQPWIHSQVNRSPSCEICTSKRIPFMLC